MLRSAFITISAVLALAACDTSPPAVAPDGRPLPTVYKIRRGDAPKIQARVLESINSLRQSAGLPMVEMDSSLNAAAAAHSQDMLLQNRAWHFGSDGSSPIDRVQRAGYAGRLIGEDISETYENETDTLSAWMETSETRNVIMSPAARHIGIGWAQTDVGKLWWTLVVGG